ncbi:MAG: DUF2207 domain-containing protein [Gemmatimonadetes bacterium]|nr:DUF2207 domain-containing protein [Gemmatimonadota bacterium]
MNRLSLFLCLTALALPGAVTAQDAEEILSYQVGIEIGSGGVMTVTEQITVRSRQREIRRGIYRDFPTSFPRESGLGRIEAPLSVQSVTRDGAVEPYTLQGFGGSIGRGGVRIRIGDPDVILPAAVHEYRIVYETQRWVLFGESTDELYWNVTGNGWGFPILTASARIRIPGLRSAPGLESWTGYEGSTTTDARAEWNEGSGIADFDTDQPLRPGEGLTVRVSFPSGVVTPPTENQESEWFALDWGGYIDSGYVLLLVIAMYLLMWRRVGVDPARGRATPTSEPPAGYSAAALGYIEKRGYHQRQLSAALVSMALKGALRIEHGSSSESSSWTLRKLDDSVTLANEERVLFATLFGERNEIALSQSYHETFRAGIKGFKKSLARRLEREYFENNRLWFLGGLVVSVLGFLALAWRWRYGIAPPAIFIGIWLTGWTVGVVTLLYRLVNELRRALSGGDGLAWVGVFALTVLTVPFMIAEVIGTGVLFVLAPSHLVFAAMAIGVTNVAFYHLLERPTLKGRGVLDQVDGFRAYVDGPSDRSRPGGIALFERHLPFTIALGLEARWAEAFDDALLPLMSSPEASRSALPWYHHDMPVSTRRASRPLLAQACPTPSHRLRARRAAAVGVGAALRGVAAVAVEGAAGRGGDRAVSRGRLFLRRGGRSPREPANAKGSWTPHRARSAPRRPTGFPS